MSYKRGSYSRSRIISIVLLIVFLFQVCNPMILQAESDQSAIFPRKYINTYTENYIADTSTINANLEENIDIYANEIIVVYKENISDQLGIQSITDNSETDNKNAELSGITIIDDNTVLLKLNPEIAIDEALDDIRKNPEVDYAEPNYRFTTQSSVSDPDYIPNDPKYSEQWGLPEIDAIKAWKESENLRNIEGENPIEPAEVKVGLIKIMKTLLAGWFQVEI